MKNYFHKHIISCFLSICIISLLSFSVSAIETDIDSENNTDKEQGKSRFALGIGTAAVRLNSNFKITDKQTGNSLFIDAEGTLNLPEIARVNTVYAGYRLAEKHSLGFAYFGINRETSLLAIDLNLDDIILIKADAKLKDETDFYQLTYAYGLFSDDRSSIKATFGLYGLDLKLAFEAEGDLTINGVTQSGTYRETVSVFAPLPLLGLDFTFFFTPKWSMRTRVALVGGAYEDVSASILTSSINARYDFSKHFGGVMGIAYFDAKVEIDDETTLNEVAYGYSGIYAGLHFIF